MAPGDSLQKQSIRPSHVQAFAQEVLQSVNVPEAHARYVAETLVDADLRGDLSHGAWRLVILVNRIQAGGIDPRAQMRWLRESTSTAILDAANGLGQIAARMAMERAVSQAKVSGVSLIAVRNSNSFLAAKSAPLLAAREGCVGFVASTSGPLVAPWGAATPLLGNSPLAFAFPTSEARPVLVDMSLAAAARGRIVQTLEAGEQLPAGWALDADGNPTQDPAQALKGTSAPIGGYKGYGLILVVEILAGLLTGAGVGAEVSLFQPFDRPQNVGHVLGAIDVKQFLPLADFRAQLTGLIGALKQQKARPGVDEVLLPGERGYRSLEQGQQEGISYPDYVLADLAEIAERLALTPLERRR